MADRKVKDEAALAYGDIDSTHLFRTGKSDSGGNNKIGVQDFIDGIILDSWSATDITWANLLTAIGGSTLSPNAIYHVTTAPDGSTTIDEAWVRAKDANEIFPDGTCLVNAANITNRLMGIRFNMAGAVGGRIVRVHDAFKNEIEGYAVTAGGNSSTANITQWLDILTASNQSVRIYGSVLNGGASGTIVDYSLLIGATAQLTGSSSFNGVCEHGSFTLDGGSNANGVYILGAGGLVLDNGSVFATGLIGAGKTITLVNGESIVGFSTERNTAIQHGGANPTGDTILVDAATGTVFVDDGSTDVTITMPDGVISGQRMTIFFLLGSAAVTWNGATTDPSTFIAAPVTGQKIEAFWDALNTTWR